MDFDFSNTSFSFLASIVVAILGIGYPLFLNNIRGIDEQYRSTRLARRFQKEHCFTQYKQWLILSIAVSVAAPFVMLMVGCINVNVLVEGVQCLVVLFLVWRMLQLFNLISKYYDIGQICFHLGITGEIDNDVKCDEDKLLCAIDIMKYASFNGDYCIYDTCRKYLYKAVRNDSQKSVGDTYNMGEVIQKAFFQIANYSTDKEHTYLYNESLISECLYSANPKRFNGECTRKVLWLHLLRMMDTDSTLWFRDYWRRATQYYSMDISHGDGKDEAEWEAIKNNLRDFEEMHWMAGAALVHYKKYEWLRFALFYSNVSPAKYPLVPSSFQDILDAAMQLRQKLVKPGIVEYDYLIEQMLNNGSDAIYMMYELAMKYFALLVIRCSILKETEKLAPHSMPEDSDDRNFMKSVAQEIYTNIDYWYNESLIHRLQFPILPQEEEVRMKFNPTTW